MKIYSEFIFPKIFDLVMRHKSFNSQRARVLQKANGKILEIGIGTGLNLNFYPQSIKQISAIDPNCGMRSELQKKQKNHRIEVDFHLSGAEKLPFADKTFDTVISTLTLCSVANLQKSLHEVKRVLKPEGKFIFFDHGLSSDVLVAKLQNLINPMRKIISCGCSVNINISEEIKEAGFNIIELNKYYLENTPKISGCIFEGIATPEI